MALLHPGKKVNISNVMITERRRLLLTGLNAGAVGFGLKEDALTFNLNALLVEELTEAVGDAGGTVDEDCERLCELLVGLAPRCLSLLNGGIAWITMCGRRDASVFCACDFAGVFAGGTVGDVLASAVAVDFRPGVLGCLTLIGLPGGSRVEVGGLGANAAAEGAELPIARALAD
jgi:type IV secretory pathway TrbD component